ncbi:hypothetical protein JCM24511_04467 [Saitozyma sp. JCM 24511]|nr:hypothetical protein JCM24511_04467 [Saitozyma sp. JCM 24511]
MTSVASPRAARPSSAGPSRPSSTISVQSTSPHMPSVLRKLRSFGFSVAGRQRTDESTIPSTSLTPEDAARASASAYAELRTHDDGAGASAGGQPSQDRTGMSEAERARVENGYEWEAQSDSEEDNEPDAYSWVDPSLVGTERLRATPVDSSVGDTPPGIHSSRGLGDNDALPPSLPPRISSAQTTSIQRPRLNPLHSYNLLVSYQSTSLTSLPASPRRLSLAGPPPGSTPSPHMSSEGVNAHQNTEWHELVDSSLTESLSREERKRQGLWWEMIKGEMEYVKDLRTVCETFIQPLREYQPPLLVPEARLHAFIAEAFSSVQQIYLAHASLLDKLMERQRTEWPLLTSATDLLLGLYLETVPLYETYMKNYPFADARVRREAEKNVGFRQYLSERTTTEITRRRDIESVFLSRPVTRLPRVMLLIEALEKCTPADHPDRDELPMVHEVLNNVVKASQPGIESAEAKIKLWNIAERLLFKRGEIIPIHLDFLQVLSADGAPERRYDGITQYRRRPGGNILEPVFQPERLMYPFTITTSGGVHARTYTLCTATPAARDQWREKIDGAKTLRRFDLEGNRIFAVHTISVPSNPGPLVAAQTFTWLGRETVAMAYPRSVYLGWRRDSHTYRELIKLNTHMITAVSVLPDFGWLFVLSSGSLLAFSLQELIPASDPATWSSLGKDKAVELGEKDRHVAFVRVGVTKGRVLVVHAYHSRNSHHTHLFFDEPLLPTPTSPKSIFRRFATLTLPGQATELSFFRQTIAVATEKAFVIAEPGNPTYNVIPTYPSSGIERSAVTRMTSGSKPLVMYQVGENEFILVYDWGACFVTKYGELSRNGTFLRWNLSPTHCAFRSPHLLLFDEAGGRTEVRDINSGKMCEIIVEEKGTKAVRATSMDADMLIIGPKGLKQIVE